MPLKCCVLVTIPTNCDSMTKIITVYKFSIDENEKIAWIKVANLAFLMLHLAFFWHFLKIHIVIMKIIYKCR